MRDIIATVVDDGFLLEPHANWAANLVTAFATIGGRPVGIVANQPQTVAGTLDIPASQKGGRFVALCDAFNLALVTFVDTSGFYPGKDTEWRGMIRYGAQMAFAYARATVPRVNLTTRKSYGGAYIVMDSKRMGNDLALAWPSAEIAVMGAKGAVEILHRRNTPDERLELEAAYEERLLNPYIAAERGTIDAVIDPADTRAEIHAALSMLATASANGSPATPRQHAAVERSILASKFAVGSVPRGPEASRFKARARPSFWRDTRSRSAPPGRCSEHREREHRDREHHHHRQPDR